jgi:ABC-type glycerol-3-phosphate transport system substrate-binding protein
MNAIQTLAVLALSAGLAACGGGSSSGRPPTATNEVPASATASPTAYSQYIGSLTKTETGRPLNVNRVEAPTSETELPLPVV